METNPYPAKWFKFKSRKQNDPEKFRQQLKKVMEYIEKKQNITFVSFEIGTINDDFIHERARIKARYFNNQNQ